MSAETEPSGAVSAAAPAQDPSVALHVGLVIVLALLHFVLPDYHHGNLARIMTLATFAMGYNILFGYTGLLSLGHAMFFAAGLYGAGLTITHLDWDASVALPFGALAAAALGFGVGLLALRTTGVAFMIVTLMFAQAGHLIAIYFNEWTGGDDGLVLPQAVRWLGPLDLSDPTARYFVALVLFAAGMLFKLWLVRSPTGRVLVAIRENEERTRLLGYDSHRYRLFALVLSALYAGVAGAAYALLFGYVGATFAAIQYSIFPLLWVLVGGAGTVLGPFLGAVLMFYLVDLASDLTSAYMIVVGVMLVLLILVAPRGVLGVVKDRIAPWLP